MSRREAEAPDVTVDVRDDAFVVLFPDDDDPRHDLINTSWYIRHSAHLPHLGREADHQIIEEMAQLRADQPPLED